MDTIQVFLSIINVLETTWLKKCIKSLFNLLLDLRLSMQPLIQNLLSSKFIQFLYT